MSTLTNEIYREIVLGLVQRAIWCPITNEVLDYRTCTVAYDEDGDPVAVYAPNIREVLGPDRLRQVQANGYTLRPSTY
jgi:hypothetical protein